MIRQLRSTRPMPPAPASIFDKGWAWTTRQPLPCAGHAYQFAIQRSYCVAMMPANQRHWRLRRPLPLRQRQVWRDFSGIRARAAQRHHSSRRLRQRRPKALLPAKSRSFRVRRSRHSRRKVDVIPAKRPVPCAKIASARSPEVLFRAKVPTPTMPFALRDAGQRLPFPSLLNPNRLIAALVLRQAKTGAVFGVARLRAGLLRHHLDKSRKPQRDSGRKGGGVFCRTPRSQTDRVRMAIARNRSPHRGEVIRPPRCGPDPYLSAVRGQPIARVRGSNCLQNR